MVANSSWALAGELIRVGSAGATFVLLARLLGPGDFGAYAGALALVLVVYPFANVGAGHLLVMRVARQPKIFRTAWSAAVSTTLVSGAACSALIVAVGSLLLPRVPVEVVLLLAVSELVFAQAVELSGQAFQAHDDMRAATQVRTAAAVARVSVVVAFTAIVDDHTVSGWSAFSLLASVVGATVAVALVHTRLGARLRLVRPSATDVRAGVPFALGLSSWQAKENIDQAMVLRAGFVADAGIYAAGYRIVSFAFLPIRAVITSTYPQFFREGERSLGDAVRFARRLAVPTVAFSMLVGLGSMFVLPLATHLLGDDFSGGASVVQALAFVPMLHVLQYLAGNSLTGSGYVRLRTALQLAAAGLNIALNLVLIPMFSWRGAVIATYAAEIVLSISLWAAVALLLARQGAASDRMAAATA
ncbi:MAG: oligosaccharide flippase family protein [Actinobacteria bacterium]|nr:oligosaccharide flippase family protein [Actinomycetota bacterium]